MTEPYLTLLVGADSNLSRRLASTIPGCRLISARALMADHGALRRYRGQRLNVVFNAFRPSTQVRDLREREQYLAQAIVPLARTLDVCRDLQVARFLYTSSASVYGDNADCREDDSPVARDVHAVLKLASEMLVQRACEEDGRPYAVMRLFNMYGGADRFSAVSKLIAAARTGAVFNVTNGGLSARDYVYVGDVVDTYSALLRAQHLPARLNVASGRAVSIRALVEALAANGAALRTRDILAAQIERSVACIDRLAGFVDVSGFAKVEDYVVKQVLRGGDRLESSAYTTGSRGIGWPRQQRGSGPRDLSVAATACSPRPGSPPPDAAGGPL